MKKLILTMAAVSALAIGAPAAAQYANSNIQVRTQQLQTRLQAGIQNGSISRQEAMSLRAQVRQLNQLERQYSRNGLSRAERNQLQRRIQDLQQGIRSAERGGNYAGRTWRAGDRYEGNYASAARYGNAYRDTDRYIYRYDNAGRIYQVDRRNNTIERVIDRR